MIKNGKPKDIQSEPNRAKRQEGNKLILLDTDAGTDDAWAIFMALSAHRTSVEPNSFKLVGITTVSGNASLDNVTNNVTRTLDTVNETVIPIYRGMSDPMINKFRLYGDPPFHGEDGFGDADLPDIPTRINPEHSVNAIIRLAETYPGQLTIVTIGPLTNLAMALKIKPEIKDLIKEVYILGGNIEGVGNMDGDSSSSEFNFFVDPEAAQVVLENLAPCPITIFPWETAIKYGMTTLDWRLNVLGTLGTPEVELMNKIQAKLLENSKDTWMAPDSLVLACIINPNIVVRSEKKYYCSVELRGSLTRGMMVLDRSLVLQKPPNVNIILQVDLPLYQALLLKSVGGV